MISSKYYKSPGLSLSPDFCFICEICSTSPCKIKNLLLVKSIPYDFNLSFTSPCVDYFPSKKYLDILFVFTVLLIKNPDPGI